MIEFNYRVIDTQRKNISVTDFSLCFISKFPYHDIGKWATTPLLSINAALGRPVEPLVGNIIIVESGNVFRSLRI